jgi:hypothetical protein
MANKEFDISVDTRQADTFFAQLAARIQNQVPFRQAVTKLIARYMEQSFAGQKTPAGVPWANLKPATIADRNRRKLVPIVKLQATKEGKKSIKIKPTSTGFVIEVVDYMDIHNRGTDKMAARRWMPTEQELTSGAISQEIREIEEAYLTQGFGGFVKGEVSRTPDFVKNLLGL